MNTEQSQNVNKENVVRPTPMKKRERVYNNSSQPPPPNVKRKKLMMFYSKNPDTIERISDYFLEIYNKQLEEKKTKKIHFDLNLYNDLDSFINVNVVNLDKFDSFSNVQACHVYRAKFKKRFHISTTNFGRWKQSIFHKIRRMWFVHNFSYLIREFN